MKIIITGSTGMIGKGVLLECLDDRNVSKVLLINRNSVGLSHPKLKEIIHKDFSNYSDILPDLAGYDACFCCMGISSAGLKEAAYKRITYDFTLSLAQTLYQLNPGMTIIYVSGVGTDSTEKGRIMWARVKGKTENDLIGMGFHQAFMFRPGAIIPRRGIVSRTPLYRFLYRYLMWLLLIIKRLNPESVVDTSQIGQAMINAVRNGYDKHIITPKDILKLAEQ